MFMKILLIAIVVVIILIMLLIVYFGGFKKLDISVKEAGGEILVFESVTGNYKNSGAVMDKIYYSLLNDAKIETYKGFGIYYDNPKKTEEAKLRCDAGCVLEAKDASKIDNLKSKYSIKTFPVKKYITTEFPHKGKISVIFSVMKVYPALAEYARSSGWCEDAPVMEIYDVPNGKIIYRKEIIQNN